MLMINYRDQRPIYEQVKDGLRTLIITGEIEPGGKMPSVRELASSLAINPNTIQRAYRELEAEGYIYSVPGKGSFAETAEQVGREMINDLLVRLDETAAELKRLGVTEEELCIRIQKGGTGK